MILLRMISGPWNWDSSSSSLPIILMLGLFMIFQMSLMFGVMSVLDLTGVSSMPEFLSFTSYILLVMLASVGPYVFHLQDSLSLCFLYCFYFHFQVLNSFIHFLHLFDCIFLYSFKGFIHFPLKGHYHLHEIRFQAISLCFNCVRICRACCNRIAGLCWFHLAMALVDCVLMLAFSHLVVLGTCMPLGMLAELWARKSILF